jgi:hypothetical protein|tara:strand:+ start:6120 stop:6296 length:177 start_codon:yes stop_codon:yes gene_type:complete
MLLPHVSFRSVVIVPGVETLILTEGVVSGDEVRTSLTSGIRTNISSEALMSFGVLEVL